MSYEVGRIEAALGFRVDDSGADRYERRLKGLRQESKRDVKTDAKLDVDQRGFDRYGKNVRDVEHHHGDLVRSSARVRTGFGTVWGAGGAAFAAAGGAYGLVKGVQAVVGAYGESQKVGAQTNQVLKSTGGAAGVSAKQVGDLATALSKKTGQDDETIQSGENLLLTFTQIRNEAGKGNDIFTQATGIMADMSQALGQDTKSSAIQLGKALNDPIKGVTALQRVGVSFTQSQKDTIKSLVETGQKTKAQKLILGELRKEFGGSAEAYGKTLPGALDKAKVAFGNLEESIGKRLAPVLTKAANWLADLFNGGGKASAGMQKVRSAVSAVGDVGRRVFGFLKSIVEDNRGSFERIGRAVSSMGQSVGRVFTGILGAAKKVFSGSSGIGGDIRSIVKVILTLEAAIQTVYAAIVKRAVPGIITTFKGLFMVIKGVVQVIAGILTLDFGKVWQGAKNIVGGAVRAIGGAIRTLTAPFRTVFAAVGSVVGKGISTAVRFIGQLPGKAIGFFRSTISGALRFGRDLLAAGASAGKRFVDRVIGFVNDLPGKVWSFLKRTVSRAASFAGDLASAGANAGRRFLNRVIDFVSDLPGKVGHFLGAVIGKAADFVGNLASKGAEAAGRFVSRAVDGVSQLPGKLAHWGATAASRLKDALVNGIKGIPGAIKNIFTGIGGIVSDIGRAIANWLNANTPLGDKVHLPGPLPDFRLPSLQRGGKVGPFSGGARAFIAGEGSADEWVISQEGDRRQNAYWAAEALQTLTGKRVELHRRGKRPKRRKRAPHFNSASQIAGNQPGRADDHVANIERDLGRLDRLYGQLERSQGLTDEQFVIENPDGSTTIDQRAVDHRVGEINDLIAFKHDRIRAKIEDYQKTLKQAIQAYNAAIKRLQRAIRSARRRHASGNVIQSYSGKIDDFRGRIAELQDAGRDLDLDLGDVDLDVEELKAERASVQGQTGTPAPDAGGSSGSSGTTTTVDPVSGVTTTTTAVDPAAVAAAAIAEVTAFNAAQSDLFSSFGSNFVRGNVDPATILGGLRNLGAAGGGPGLFGAADAGGGGVTVNINQTYSSPAPPHLWTDDVARRVQGALG